MGAHLKQAGVKAPIYRETKRVVGNISVLRQKVFSSCDKIYFLLGEERKYIFTENELAKNCDQSPQSSQGTLQCHSLWAGCGKCRDCRELKSTSRRLTNTLDQTSQISGNVIIIIIILMLVIYWDWPMCILVQPTNPCQRTLLTREPERLGNCLIFGSQSQLSSSSLFSSLFSSLHLASVKYYLTEFGWGYPPTN